MRRVWAREGQLLSHFISQMFWSSRTISFSCEHFSHIQVFLSLV